MYGSGGVPFSEAAIAQIQKQIDVVAEAPRFMRFYELDKVKERGLYHELGEAEQAAYLAAVKALLPAEGGAHAAKAAREDFLIAYAPLEGLGAPLVEGLLKERGHKCLTVSPQREAEERFASLTQGGGGE